MHIDKIQTEPFSKNHSYPNSLLDIYSQLFAKYTKYCSITMNMFLIKNNIKPFDKTINWDKFELIVKIQ